MLQQCENCQYFREEGYAGTCQLHHAHVIKTFFCERFMAHDLLIDAGDANHHSQRRDVVLPQGT